MRKIQASLISIIFTVSSVNAQLLPTANPYSIGPEGRIVEDLRDFAKPNQMFSIIPNRPVVATDSYGNRQYYTPMGKLAVSISKGGDTLRFILTRYRKLLMLQENLSKQKKMFQEQK